jgi:hypothetical protein
MSPSRTNKRTTSSKNGKVCPPRKDKQEEQEELGDDKKRTLGFPLWMFFIPLLLCEMIRITVSSETQEDYGRLLSRSMSMVTRFGNIENTFGEDGEEEELYIPLDFDIVSIDAIMVRKEKENDARAAQDIPLPPSGFSASHEEKVRDEFYILAPRHTFTPG